MTARITKTASVLAFAAVATLTLASCASEDPTATTTAPGTDTESADGTVKIGTANFPESEIIGQIWAEALREAGFDVEVTSGIGSREVYITALEEGSINLVPEYSGNLTQYFGELPAGADEDAVRDTLRSALPAELEAGDFAPGESKDAYRVTKETAEKYNLVTIGDLGNLDTVTIAAPPEFAERPYGPEGLTGVYGIDASKITVTPISDGGGPLTVAALLEGKADAANIYTTSPALNDDGEEADLVTLEDPENLIPPQNILPLYRAGELPDGALDVINSVNATLTTEDLVSMNLRNVGKERAEPAQIAKEYVADRK
ncbi:ABC transporter substrate-binding protein [Corynebacterium glaucum]|uniref:ABC transporter substrate-binding protein n=1 Tax=Corynebacterium glaucum TaxID=187491 RepID=UPI0026590261|nr:ABC transporter substrate-binding protein [Corynebacterium glaucum]